MPMRYAMCFAALTMSILAIDSGAQSTKPADPATAPERTIKIDRSSPKAAVQTFVAGWVRGDTETVKKAAIADDEQAKFIDQMTSGQAALKNLEDVAVRKFGPDGQRVASFSAKVDKVLENLDLS